MMPHWLDHFMGLYSPYILPMSLQMWSHPKQTVPPSREMMGPCRTGRNHMTRTANHDMSQIETGLTLQQMVDNDDALQQMVDNDDVQTPRKPRIMFAPELCTVYLKQQSQPESGILSTVKTASREQSDSVIAIVAVKSSSPGCSNAFTARHAYSIRGHLAMTVVHVKNSSNLTMIAKRG